MDITLSPDNPADLPPVAEHQPVEFACAAEPGARLALHLDRNERDFGAPIVSVSLGLHATFLWGGAKRSDRPEKVPLRHGDVVVWGGPARMTFHGVMPLPEGEHPLVGRRRFNLTLRRAL